MLEFCTVVGCSNRGTATCLVNLFIFLIILPLRLVCLGNEFNCTLDSTIDQNSVEPHPDSARPLSTLLSRNDFGDVWRLRHGNAQQFTWCCCLLKNLLLARLDKFYIRVSFLNGTL